MSIRKEILQKEFYFLNEAPSMNKSQNLYAVKIINSTSRVLTLHLFNHIPKLVISFIFPLNSEEFKLLICLVSIIQTHPKYTELALRILNRIQNPILCE